MLTTKQNNLVKTTIDCCINLARAPSKAFESDKSEWIPFNIWLYLSLCIHLNNNLIMNLPILYTGTVMLINISTLDKGNLFMLDSLNHAFKGTHLLF